jgi:hypothetical protein
LKIAGFINHYVVEFQSNAFPGCFLSFVLFTSLSFVVIIFLCAHTYLLKTKITKQKHKNLPECAV